MMRFCKLFQRRRAKEQSPDDYLQLLANLEEEVMANLDQLNATVSALTNAVANVLAALQTARDAVATASAADQPAVDAAAAQVQAAADALTAASTQA